MIQKQNLLLFLAIFFTTTCMFPLKIKASTETSENKIVSFLKAHKTKTAIFSCAILWHMFDNYLTKKGDRLLEEPIIETNHSGVVKTILYYLDKIIGYRIKKNKPVTITRKLKNNDVIEMKCTQKIKTDLSSSGLGWVMDMLVTPLKDNSFFKLFLPTIKNVNEFEKILS